MLRILFITRNYPPKVGGLEEYSYHLIREFESRVPTHKITLSKSKKHLPWFFPYSFFKALYVIRKYPVSHVHLCDGMLAPVGQLLKGLTGTTVTATVHGLDITYRNPLYQKVIPLCIESLDRIVCVSRSTREEVLTRTRIFPENCAVIPNGVNSDEMCLPQSKSELLRKFESVNPSNIFKPENFVHTWPPGKEKRGCMVYGARDAETTGRICLPGRRGRFRKSAY